MSKYSVAKDGVNQVVEAAKAEGIEAQDVLEALIVTAIQELKQHADGAYIKGFLQYETDSVGSGGTYEIQRR